MLYAWSDDAGADWSRDSDATICNVSSPSAQCAQAQARITDRCSAPPPDTVFPDTSLTAAVASQGMVTLVTRTTHCTYHLAGTCHLVNIQGLSIFILVDTWYFF